MIDDSVLDKFYKELTPFSDVIHSIGLLHTARQKDVAYGKKLLSSSLKQKYPDYCAIIMYESTLKSKPVLVFKIIKEGKRNMGEQIDRLIPWLNSEYSHEKDCSYAYVYLDAKSNVTKRIAEVKRKLFLSASFAGYRYVIGYDMQKEHQRLWSRKFKAKASNKE